MAENEYANQIAAGFQREEQFSFCFLEKEVSLPGRECLQLGDDVKIAAVKLLIMLAYEFNKEAIF